MSRAISPIEGITSCRIWINGIGFVIVTVRRTTTWTIFSGIIRIS